MPKTVSASEAKNRLGSMMDWVTDRQDEVIIEKRGNPRAVIISFEEYERVSELREKARRQQALARLENLREAVARRNKDLDEQQSEALSDQFEREVVEEMVEEGKIRFSEH